MSLVKTDYFHLACNGPATLPWEKTCTATSPGGFDQVAMEAEAVALNWSVGRKTYCPQHRHQAAAETDGSADLTAALVSTGRRQRRTPKTSGEQVTEAHIPADAEHSS